MEPALCDEGAVLAGCRVHLGSQAAGAAGGEPPMVAAFRTLFSGSLSSVWHIAQALLPAAAAPLIGWLAVVVPHPRGRVLEVLSPSCLFGPIGLRPEWLPSLLLSDPCLQKLSQRHKASAPDSCLPITRGCVPPLSLIHI